MKPIYIKKAFLSFVLVILSTLTTYAQQTLWVGQSYNFDVSSSVMGLTANMSWSTSGGYLSLSGSGLYRTITVTQYFSGTATVTCEWDYKLTGNGSYTHTKRQVTISCRDNQVSISPTSLTMSPGETRYVSYRHQYDNQYTSNANAYFQSSDPSICTVSPSGEVIAMNPGTTYINVYSKISSVSPYCVVTVKKVEPNSISLPSSITMTAGETQTLSPILYPSNAQTSYSWTSSDNQIASVSSSGIITAKKYGTTVVSVRTSNGLTASCEVTVNKRQLSLISNFESGLVRRGSELTLSSDIPNSTIYYTTDGSSPSITSNKYTDPISINDDLILKAVCVLDGYIDSDILSLDFKVTTLDLTNNQKNILYDYQFINIAFNDTIQKGVNFDKMSLSVNDNLIGYTPIIQDSHIYLLLDEYIPDQLYKVSIPENSVKNRLGQPNFTISQTFQYKNGTNLKSLVTGGQCYCLALSEDGELYSWGFASDPLGRNCTDQKDANTPKKIEGLNNIIKYGATSRSSFALDSNGMLYAWGTNEYGELGLGNKESVKYPMIIQRDVKDAFVSYCNIYYVKNDGSLWGSGSNEHHQLGIEGSSTYTFKKLLDNVSKIAHATGDYCYVIKDDSTLWGSGGRHGASYDWCLGHGAVTSNTFVKILEDVRDVYISDRAFTDVYAITNDLNLYGWGNNNSGELGLGHKNKVFVPNLIKTNIVDFAAGFQYALALDTDGTLWSWGDNEYGCLGIGNHVSTLVPVYVCKDIKKVSCCSRYVTALDKNNDLFSWGDNGCGWYDANGNDLSTKERVSPELILNDIKFMESAVGGGTYNYAIGNNGYLWYWTVSNPKSPKLEGINQIKDIFTPNELTVYKDSFAVIPLEINPINGDYDYVEWDSDNEEIVKCISPGVILTNNTGETNVTVTVVGRNGEKYSSITHIIVRDESAGTNKIVIDSNTGIEIYNIQGLYCGKCIQDLMPGVYIIKKGETTKKVVVN